METLRNWIWPQTVTDDERSENDASFSESAITQRSTDSASPMSVPPGETSRCIRPVGVRDANAPRPAPAAVAVSNATVWPAAPFAGADGRSRAVPVCPLPPVPRYERYPGVPRAVDRPRAPAFCFGRPAGPAAQRTVAGYQYKRSATFCSFQAAFGAPIRLHGPRLWRTPPKVRPVIKPLGCQQYAPELAQAAAVRQCGVRLSAVPSTLNTDSRRRTSSTPASFTQVHGRTSSSRRAARSSFERSQKSSSASESEDTESSSEELESDSLGSDVSSRSSSSSAEESEEECAAFKIPATSCLSENTSVTQMSSNSATPKSELWGETSRCINPVGLRDANALRPTAPARAVLNAAVRPEAPFTGACGRSRAAPAYPLPPALQYESFPEFPPAVCGPRPPAFFSGRPAAQRTVPGYQYKRSATYCSFPAGAGCGAAMPFRGYQYKRSATYCSFQAGAGFEAPMPFRGPRVWPAPPRVRPFMKPPPTVQPRPCYRPTGPLWPAPPKVQPFSKPQVYRPYDPALAQTAAVRQWRVRRSAARSTSKTDLRRRTSSTPASSTHARRRTRQAVRSTSQDSRTEKSACTTESETTATTTTTEELETYTSAPPSDVTRGSSTSSSFSTATTEECAEERAAFKIPVCLPAPPTGPWLEPATGRMTSQMRVAIDDFVRTATLIGVKGFTKQHAAMRKFRAVSYSTKAFKANRKKNRYNNVDCIDATRVVLKINVPPKSDYIHANWVKMDYVKQVFIATQAPKGDTTEDFWRMCYQESIRTIVVLCNVIEKGKPQCAQYWPVRANSKASYGAFTVRSRKVVRDRSLETYSLSVAAAGRLIPLSLKLLHLTNWPDNGIPLSGTDVHRILYCIDKDGPCVVHCSAGIGRTGTILAIATVIERLFKGVHVRMEDVLKELRSQRASAVQTDVQYAFIVLAVLDYIGVKFPSLYSAQIAAFRADVKKEEAEFKKKVLRLNAKTTAKSRERAKNERSDSLRSWESRKQVLSVDTDHKIT